MAKRKLKKKPKIILISIILLVLVGSGLAIYFTCFNKKNVVKEAKVLSKINDYGYVLKSNKSEKYKKLFDELKVILNEKKVDEEKYVKKITEMFIVDFYSLSDRSAKTDVGGVDFIHEDALQNFIVNAEDTMYKYVENNIYGDRKQELPIVDEITITDVSNTEYSYLEEIDENAYQVTAKWTYKDDNSSDGYPTESVFTFVHAGKKLVLVEISKS